MMIDYEEMSPTKTGMADRASPSIIRMIRGARSTSDSQPSLHTMQEGITAASC